MLVLGAGLAWAGMKQLILGVRSGGWPTVQGTVKSAKLMQKSKRWGGSSYYPAVTYVYEVNGVSHTGNQISTGDVSSSELLEAMAALAKYPEGGEIDVHYDPGAPEVSLLETGSHGVNWLSVGLGTVVFVIGGFSARTMWRKLHDDDFSQSGGL